MTRARVTDYEKRHVEAHWRNTYAPFKLEQNIWETYDLRLRKYGMVANIIGNIIVSIDGSSDPDKANAMINELGVFGFKRHN